MCPLLSGGRPDLLGPVGSAARYPPQMMDQTQLLNALRALGNDVTYDPEHYPDGPTEGDIPHLLGSLALMLDVAIAERVRPNGPAASAFQSGYVAVSLDVETFVRAAAVRASTAALLLHAPELADNETTSRFSKAVKAAADAWGSGNDAGLDVGRRRGLSWGGVRGRHMSRLSRASVVPRLRGGAARGAGEEEGPQHCWGHSRWVRTGSGG